MQAAFIKGPATGQSNDLGKPQMIGVCPLCAGTQVSGFLKAPDRLHWRKDVYTLRRCSLCSCVWLNDPPKPEEMGIHYDEEYHKVVTSGGEQSAERRWQRQRDVIHHHKQGGTILDVGCSSGGFLSTMKGGPWKLYGIEMEESTAARARAKTGAEVFVGDAVRGPFPERFFDVVTAFDLLEHVYAPRELLGKVLEWLKPGGIFVAMVPNIESWEARLFGSYWYGLELPRHLFHFSPRSLRQLVAVAGFEEVSVDTPRVSYVAESAEYVYSRMIEKLGFSPTPRLKPRPQTVARRVFRKGIYVLSLAPFAQLASWAGTGPSVEVILRKPRGDQPQLVEGVPAHRFTGQESDRAS